MHELLSAAENIRKEQAAEWQKTLEEAAAAKQAAEDGNAGLREELLKTQRDSATAIEVAAAEAKDAAEILSAQKLAQAEVMRKESEAALLARVEQAELATEQAKAAMKQAVDTAVAESWQTQTGLGNNQRLNFWRVRNRLNWMQSKRRPE